MSQRRRKIPANFRLPIHGWMWFQIVLAALLASVLAFYLLGLGNWAFWTVFLLALAGAILAAILYSINGTPSEASQPVYPSPSEAQVLEGLAVPIMTFSAAGSISATNAEARSLLELGLEEVSEPAELFVDLGRPVRDWICDVAAGRLPGGSEMLGLRGRMHLNEAERFIRVTLRADGRGGAIAVLQDSTAIKQLEAQFVQGQKMQAIGQLAGGIAHDFNNLLTAITGHCDLLLLRHRTEDQDYPDLIQIRQNANRAAALVAQLLAFSRKQTLKPERIDLGEALADLTHLLNRLLGEKVELDLVPMQEPAAIRADHRQLEQVIMNLVVNARDAMPDGGVVQIETRIVRLDGELPREKAVIPRGAHVVIAVRDTGRGIPAEWIEKIFEPFFTTKRQGEGTGLGLSTTYGIVKQSGGFIFVQSVPGEGTEFELWFPLCLTEPTTVPLPKKRRVPKKAEGVVLLVEDEAPVRAFAARALRLRGHSVLEASSAEEALRILDDGRVKIDVFVTDVVMPGLDGPGWVAQALEARPGVRTVFISGYAEEALSDMQARIPNSVFLAKPFTLIELTDTVQAQLAA